MNTMTETRPFTAHSFRAYLAEERLMASRCTTCGHAYLPPRPICPACHSEQMAWEQATGRGTLQAFTVVYVTPSAMAAAGYGREKPYISAIIEVDSGLRISARLLEADPLHPETLRIGSPGEVVFFKEAENEPLQLGFRLLGAS